MDDKQWNDFVSEKTKQLIVAEAERMSVSRYAVMWMLINLFRFLLDWHDEWKAKNG